MTTVLEKRGYEIITASDGEEALVRLRQKRPDLVITDFWMARMNGLELVQNMQEHEEWRSIPVLLMTAAHDSEMARAPGLVGIVAKPMKFEVLLGLVKQILPRQARG